MNSLLLIVSIVSYRHGTVDDLIVAVTPQFLWHSGKWFFSALLLQGLVWLLWTKLWEKGIDEWPE